MLAPTLASLFPASLVVFTFLPAPVPSRVRVHPLVSFASSSEFQPLRPCLRADAETPSLGFCSPSRHQYEKSTCERASQARPTVRPQRFSRSRRFPPPRTLRVCFAPLPRPGFTFQGFCPAAKPVRLVGGPCPPVVGGSRLSPSCLDDTSSTRPASRALIRAAIRGHRRSV